MISIINLGTGDVDRLCQVFEYIGYNYVVTMNPDVINQAGGIILYGESSFADAMLKLQANNLVSLIKEKAFSGKPLLGIGLGMQLLFTSSDEKGFYQGLNLFSGHVISFEEAYHVPHMGWNWLSYRYPHPLFLGLDEGQVYFLHSYYVTLTNDEDAIATTDYYQKVISIVARHNVYGMQFFPERSGGLGVQLLQQFVKSIGS